MKQKMTNAQARILCCRSRHWYFRYLRLAIIFLSVFFFLPNVWATPGSYVVPIKDRSGRQIGSFPYKASYALLVGISDYTGGWPRLPGVKTDVREIKKVLERLGFQVEVAEDLTQAELERTYRNFVLRYGLDAESRLLFYFAGHGYTIRPLQTTDPAAWLGVLVARDAPLPGIEPSADFRSHTLSIERFASMAREMTAKHALFIFDSCFSGARGFAVSVPGPDELIAGITRRTPEAVRQFISSGTADQQVPDTSEFRRQFIAALNGEADRNEDGYITGSELGAFLQQKVARYTKQTPVYGKIQDSLLDRGDFVFPLSSPSFRCVPVSLPSNLPRRLQNSLGMEFLLLPAAEYTRGKEGQAPQETSHQVTLTHALYFGKYEVTQGQWSAIMKDDPTRATGDANLPIANVSWTDVQQFLRKLNEKEGTQRYRLPTEAEWEFAARCTKEGTEFRTDPEHLERYAWYDANADKRAHSVGQLLANDWGLHDIFGNVWEWCADWYGDYSTAAATDPKGPAQGMFRVYRGCGWERGASEAYCQATSRHGARPSFRHPALGFRVVMMAPTQK